MSNEARVRERVERRGSILAGIARTLPPVRRLVEQRDELRQEVQHLRRKNARLLETKRALRADLRESHGADGPLQQSHRQDLGYLFIVAYGRSGSTLLQGIISSTPGYLIRGENGGIAYQLHRFHAIADRRSAPKRARWNSPRSAWFGMGDYPREEALAEFRRLLLTTVLRPGDDSRVVGFKEIRWLQTDLHEYADFLREVFPGARFVVNTRNLDDVVASKWWAGDPHSRETLEAAEARMLGLLDRLGDDAYHVHYDDYVQNPDKLRGLFEWLGEDFDDARVAEVMAQRHSY
jgi:Sulfotransferase family